MPFEPVRGSAKQPGRVITNIFAQATENGFRRARETIADWPVVARRVYFLNLVGMEMNSAPTQWLAAVSAEEFDDVLDALTAAECVETATFIKKALRVAIDDGCCGWAGPGAFGPDAPHLLGTVDDDWIAAHTEAADFTWDTLDLQVSVRLNRDEVWPRTKAYVRDHLDELVLPKTRR